MNFFIRPSTLKRVPKQYKAEKDIVTYMRQNKLVKTKTDAKGNVDPDDYEIEEVAVETERVNRQDYINSFREDVGIANILKKVALSGDATLLNQVKRNPLPVMADGKEMVQDITPLQDGEEAVGAMGDNMLKTYAALPDDLKAGRTLEQFLTSVSQAEIDAYVAAQVAKKQGGNA